MAPERKAAWVSFQDDSPQDQEEFEEHKREEIKTYKHTLHLSASTCYFVNKQSKEGMNVTGYSRQHLGLRVSDLKSPRMTHTHIEGSFLLKYFLQILKAAREKQQRTHKGIPIRITADLSIETLLPKGMAGHT